MLGCTVHYSNIQGALPEVLDFALLSPGDLVVVDGPATAGWLQGHSCWGARGFFPASCVKELCLSSQTRRWQSQSALLQLPVYSMGQARALMGLSAQLDEELDFREGDVITIIGVPEPGWFEGELAGRRGIFPEGFVELLGPLRSAEELVEPGGDHIVNGETPVPVGAEPGLQPDDDSEQPGTYGVALYRFQALEPNELDFDVGDRIRILGTLEDGWLEGSLRGRTGVFPYRFVKICSEARAEESPVGPQAPDLPGGSELSPGPSENNSGTEEERSAGNGAGTPPCATLEASVPLGTLLSPGDTDVCENEGESTALPPSSPATEHWQPLPEDSSTEDLPQVVNGDPSQQHSPPHPQLQKTPHWSTAGGSPPHPEDPGPQPVQTQGYTSLPARRTGSPPRTRQKPGPPLTRDTFPSASWTVGTSGHHSLPLPRMARSATMHHAPRDGFSTLSPAADRVEVWPADDEKAPGLGTLVPAQDGGSTDLDSKLTQQLMEFEKSLSVTEPEKICRRFSMADFSSEKDIVRGSAKLLAPRERPFRKKALRPPPPRPSTPASTPFPGLVDQNQRPELPLPVRPSRPAPLPPSLQQRRSTTPAKSPASPHPSSDSLERQGPETVERTLDQPSQCPLVLVRIQEMEQDLETYGQSHEELSLMLEKQEEPFRAETLGNLQFYESNMESLNLELQQLRGK